MIVNSVYETAEISYVWPTDKQAFGVHPVVAILGPRQCGKTTLAQLFQKQKKRVKFHHFDLENPTDLNRLDNPMLMLKDLEGIIVINEIQLRPDLFSVLHVLVDQNPKQRFLILGSASGELDLLLIKRGKRLGFEFKFSDAPKMTRSMELALDMLNLDSLTFCAVRPPPLGGGYKAQMPFMTRRVI